MLFLFLWSSQILNVKPPVLPHKSKMGVVNGSSSIVSSTINNKATKKEERKVRFSPSSQLFCPPDFLSRG